jgi:hypothetical protein
MKQFGLSLIACAGLALSASTATALEYPIGEPQFGGGLEVAAVYLQPIEMDPPGMMRAAAESDVHLEADIHALADNPNGLAEGEWAPYLLVRYRLAKEGSSTEISGEMMPMVASDGPHYGDNIKLDGPGRYRLTLTVLPPTADTAGHFGRHTDRETGVNDWFAPFDLTYDFVFAGVGKKGSY